MKSFPKNDMIPLRSINTFLQSRNIFRIYEIDELNCRKLSLLCHTIFLDWHSLQHSFDGIICVGEEVGPKTVPVHFKDQKGISKKGAA